jgi:trimethylamine monooxygenase
VTARNATNEYTETFDHVIVASGHFSTPNVPHVPGLSKFNGIVMHAHDFKDGHSFKDKKVVVVGSSFSSEDIASQLHKFGAAQVIISHRKKDPNTGKWMNMPYEWPVGISEKPLISDADDSQLIFADGSSESDIDAVILCTGYKYHFPYLGKDLALECTNKLWVSNLKNGVISLKNSKLFYMAMQNQFFTFNMLAA